MLNPFALPLHAPIVHLPVAMLTITWVCVIVRHVSGSARWDERTRLFEVVGVLSGTTGSKMTRGATGRKSS